jgi:predicted RNA polymerase sigma factor
MTYRRLIQQVEESCKESIETNLQRSIHFDAALKANVEWQQIDSSYDALYEISTSLPRQEINRLRKIAVTPTDGGGLMRRWFKEGEEI